LAVLVKKLFKRSCKLKPPLVTDFSFLSSISSKFTSVN
jgi:hypothetical protein